MITIVKMNDNQHKVRGGARIVSFLWSAERNIGEIRKS